MLSRKLCMLTCSRITNGSNLWHCRTFEETFWDIVYMCLCSKEVEQLHSWRTLFIAWPTVHRGFPQNTSQEWDCTWQCMARECCVYWQQANLDWLCWRWCFTPDFVGNKKMKNWKNTKIARRKSLMGIRLLSLLYANVMSIASLFKLDTHVATFFASCSDLPHLQSANHSTCNLLPCSKRWVDCTILW